MKKLPFSLLALLIVGGIFLLPCKVRAGGPAAYNIRLTPSASSVTVGGTISVDVYAYEYHCSLTSGAINYYYLDPSQCAANGHGTANEVAADPGSTQSTRILVSGNGNSMSSATVSPDASGHASFSFSSSVAETKAISAAYNWDPSTAVTTIQVAFVAAAAPAPAPAPSTSAPTRSTTPSPTTTAPTVTTPAAPAAPSLLGVKVDGSDASPSTQPHVESSKPLVLSGKTVPNGVVTLTIHSTPRTATATADKDGNWSYTISGLEPGSHYVEAAVTDPATKQTSPVAKLLSFTVAAPKTIAAVATNATARPVAKKSPVVFIVIVVAVVGALGVGGWFWWKKKKHHQLPTNPPAPTDTTGDTTDTTPPSQPPLANS